jgi:hypothetical protein
MLVVDSAGATVRRLGDALTDIEVNGHFFRSVALRLTWASDRRAPARPERDRRDDLRHDHSVTAAGRDVTRTQ